MYIEKREGTEKAGTSYAIYDSKVKKDLEFFITTWMKGVDNFSINIGKKTSYNTLKQQHCILVDLGSRSSSSVTWSMTSKKYHAKK